MLLAIDTDLFRTALKTKAGKRAIEWILDNYDDLVFDIDLKGDLRKDYSRFIDEFDDQEELSVRFLSNLMNNDWSDKTSKLPSTLPHDIQSIVAKKCNEPVEPILIGMGCHAKKLDYVILLDLDGDRKRGLREQQVREQLCKQLSIRVVFPETKISFPTLESESKTEKDFWFEDKCREALREIFGWQHSYTKTPKVVESAVGDIDVYGYRDESIRLIWIGECQFRRRNQSNPVETRKIQQLVKKQPVVEEYEALKTNKPIRIKKHMISNAHDLHQDAWQLLAQIGGTFVRVSLNNDKPHWGIESMSEFAPIQNEHGIWSGHLLHVYSNDDGSWIQNS